jgi:mono/diheme cytochrome c family protein
MTMPRTTAAFFLIFSAALQNSAIAADAQKGETLAKRWCDSCHIISTSQQQGTAQAPPFSAVASKPDFNETMIAYFLLSPHPRMPDMSLSRSEAADLAAYIKLQR